MENKCLPRLTVPLLKRLLSSAAHIKALYLFFSLFLILLFFSGDAPGQTDFSLINSAYKYDPGAAVRVRHQIAGFQDSVNVYLQVQFNVSKPNGNYSIGYLLKENYGTEIISAKDSIALEKFLIGSEDQTYHLKIPLKLDEGVNLFLLKINTPSQTFIFDIPLRLKSNFSAPNLLIVKGDNNIPVFSNFVSSGEPFKVIRAFGTSDSASAFFYQYKYAFPPALPPMAGPEEVSKTLEIDSIFSVPTDVDLRLDTEGLYFVQLDTNSLEGLSIRIVDAYYPKYARVEDLINPLVYISTRSEYLRLAKADEKKRALDKYWLDLIKPANRAKSTIKNFYSQIELANKYFTTYKEGWKTDKGAIFILYGPPDEVYFNGEEEQWVYEKDNELLKVKFSFMKIKSIFTDQHFDLVRSKSYEKVWYGNVELWRKGIKVL